MSIGRPTGPPRQTVGTRLTTGWPDLSLVILKSGPSTNLSLYGAPQMAIHTIDKQPFHVIPEGLTMFERLPPRQRNLS
jgi:hypothetical protein